MGSAIDVAAVSPPPEEHPRPWGHGRYRDRSQYPLFAQKTTWADVKKKPNKRLHVFAQFPDAEHPGSRHDEPGPRLYLALGGRSCRSSHLHPISSSPDPRALPKYRRCFSHLEPFLISVLQGRSAWRYPSDPNIEFSSIDGRESGEDFFGKEFALRPHLGFSHSSKSKSVCCFFHQFFRE